MLDVLTSYSDLMTALDELPVQVANHQEELNELQLVLSSTRRHLEEKRQLLISANGGWSALGKNESERELYAKTLVQQDRSASALQASIYNTERDITRAQALVDDSTRRYGAVCYKTRLHAALLTYLGSAGAPVSTPEIDFGMGSRSSNGSTQPTLSHIVNSDDAKAIGL